MLPQILKKEIERRGLTVREAAKEIGLSHTALYEIMSGKDLHVSTANQICKWLGISLSTALADPADKETQAAAAIAVILHKVPQLALLFQEAAAAVDRGEIKPEEFQSIIEFAAFQLHKNRKDLGSTNVKPVEEGTGETYR